MVGPLRILGDLGKLGINQVPKTVFWAIINHCNAVCTTCSFYRNPKSSWKFLSYQDARKATDILYDSGFKMTSITGGEPLMNPDVFEICDYIYNKGMIITYLPTNGTLVDKITARRLKDADVRLVGISIDLDDGSGMGLTRKIPNLRTTIIRARENLESVGLKTYAGIVLTKSTLDIPRILSFAAELGFERIIFSYPQSIQSSSYLASSELQDLVLSVNELESAVEQIKAAKKSSPTKIHNPKISLDELLRFYRGQPRKFSCQGGKKLYYLDWNLDLYRCFTLPKKYGNLLSLGKVDFEESDACDQCMQQAFRDHDPFYYLADALAESKAHPRNIMKAIRDERTLHAINAVTEFVKGGFL